MSKTPQYVQRGYPLPTIIDPENCVCVCVPIPDDPGHIRAFLGQLDMLGYWYTWERDLTHGGKEAADVWRGIVECVRWRLDNDCGCGGGGSLTPTNQRLNANYELEVSYDGGVTWQSGNNLDPRFTSPLFPPSSETDPDLLKCQAANSIVVELINYQQADLARKELNATAAEFAEALIAFLIALGIITAGLTAFLAAIGAAIGSFFANLTAEEFENAFTSAVWDAVLCYLYCNMESDGTFTESGWNSVQVLVRDEIGGVAGEWLFNTISSMGVVGLANAGRKGNIGTRDCDLCDCDLTWCYEWRWDADDHPRGTWSNYMVNGAVGSFVLGTGFTATDGTTLDTQGNPIGYRGISQGVNISARTVTRVKVVFDYAKGNVDFGNGGAEAIQLNGTNVQFNTFNNLPASGSNIIREWIGSMANVTDIRFVIRSSRDGSSPFTYGGSITWKYVRIEGIGENPFAETDNCLD